MNTKLWLPLPLLVAALSLSTCGKPEEAQQPAPSVEEPPRKGGTIIVGWTTGPSGLNELTAPSTTVTNEILAQTFQHLLLELPAVTDGPPRFEGQLAYLPKKLNVGQTLTFHLRENLLWSDGTPLTADDVRFSWEAQTHPTISWRKKFMKNLISDVEVVDPRTVRFHFTRPYHKQMFDANEGLILPKHLWGRLDFSEWTKNPDWFLKNRVASGPFMVTSWNRDKEIILERNPNYWEKGRPNLDKVILKIDNTDTLIEQLIKGQLDFIVQVPPQDEARILARRDLDLEVVPFWSNLYVAIAWNNEKEPFTDDRVRRALTWALDREEIVSKLLPNDTGRVCASPIIQTSWAYKIIKPQPWPYSPIEAQRLLATAGWKDTDGDGILDKGGRKFSFDLITNNEYGLRPKAAELVRDQLKKAGIEVTVRPLSQDYVLQRVKTTNFDAAIMGFTADTSLDLYGNYHGDAIAQGDNFFRYRNDNVNSLIERAAIATTAEDTIQQLKEIVAILHNEQPATYLWESKRIIAYNRRIRGVRLSLQGEFFNLKDWWISSAP